MVKVCSKCNESKSIDKFRKIKGTNRRRSECAECGNAMCRAYRKRTKDERKEKKAAFRRTPDGIADRIYDNQQQHSKTRNHPPPEYSFNEFKEWLYSQPNWDDIWNNYVNSNFNTMQVPSVDRLDNSIHYTLYNIQLLTRKQHFKKSGRELRDGSDKRVYKPIIGTCIKTGEQIRFFNQAEAGRNGFRASNINACLRGKYKYAGGYTWKYA